MKFIKTFFISFLLILILISTILYLSKNSIIKSVITKISTKALKIPFSLGEVQTKIFNGYLSLKNIKIGNSDNWEEKNTIEIKEIIINIKPLSLLNDTIIINQLTIHSPHILYDFQFKKLKDNITTLLDNIIDRKIITTKTKIETKLNTEKKLFISNLQILNVTITTKIKSIKNQFTIPNIIIKDINNKKLTVKELIKIIGKNILLNINDKELIIKSTESKKLLLKKVKGLIK